MTISPPRRNPTDDAAIEELAARAWCREQVRSGNWVLRAADGFTAMANSVAVLGDGSSDGADAPPVGERIAEAEGFYRRRGLPARFQLAEGDRHASLADQLQRRGYAHEDGEDGTWFRCPLRNLRSVAPAERDGRVVVSEAPSEDWCELWYGAQGLPAEGRDAAFELAWELEGRWVFAGHVSNGELVGVGLARLDGPWLGIYGLGVRADRLRRGSGRRIVGALATWGIALAAQTAYAPVPDAATGAVGLFEALPFTAGGRYRFMVRPLG
ncbi:MAG: GNAT family N-acetyltransferase [Acidimicrobiales bacterium]